MNNKIGVYSKRESMTGFSQYYETAKDCYIRIGDKMIDNGNKLYYLYDIARASYPKSRHPNLHAISFFRNQLKYYRRYFMQEEIWKDI